MSLGVQDFDPAVQKAVNRIQSLAETRLVIDSARACGFRGINVDLIYGLPFQSVASFADTLKQVIDLNPDRLAVFNYAHLPSRFRAQRMLKAEDMPAPEVKLQMLALTAETLTQAGYALVGMDHYARAEDELVRAQTDGTLYRNFQGYSIHRACDMVGMGVSAISMVNDTYAQNHKELPHYAEGVRAGHIPVHAGYAMTRDDIIRRECITEIMCNFVLPFRRMEALFGIRFADYFAQDLVRLQSLQDDGLIRITPDDIEILPRGVPLIRHVAMAFDAYLHKQDANRFSKVI
jgi:oxygen-independent coproporphyrinogen-3 oxidase